VLRGDESTAERVKGKLDTLGDECGQPLGLAGQRSLRQIAAELAAQGYFQPASVAAMLVS
jgi:hypothetical protein